MKRIILVSFLLTLGVAVILGSDRGYCGPAVPDSVKDFYRNNTVNLVVTFGPGGGTDAVARIIAAQWKAVTGGNMMVKNIVGAGGVMGVNQMYTSKPDGLTLGLTDNVSALLGSFIFKNPGVRFDPSKFVYLGVTVIDPCGIGLSPRLPYESMEDLRKAKGLKFSGEGIDAMAAGSALMITLFGLKDAVIVPGYSGMEEQGLALARGEADAYTNGLTSMQDHIKKGFVKKVITVYSYERNPLFPDAPLPTELVKLTPEQEKMYKILVSIKAAKPVIAPPGLLDDKTEFLRDALEKVFQSEGYLNMIKVRWPKIYPGFHATGEEWTKVTKELLAISESDRDKFIGLIRQYTR